MIREVLEFASGYHLKNMKKMQGQDGVAWSATLYKDNRRLGTIIDEAHGAELRIEIPKEDFMALKEHARGHIEPVMGHVDIFLAVLADHTEAVQSMIRRNKKYPVAIHLDTVDKYGVPQMYSQFKVPNTPEQIERIREHNPGVVLLNDELHLWELRSNPSKLAAALQAMPPRDTQAEPNRATSRPRN